jgi:hypothetical protein
MEKCYFVKEEYSHIILEHNEGENLLSDIEWAYETPVRLVLGPCDGKNAQQIIGYEFSTTRGPEVIEDEYRSWMKEHKVEHIFTPIPAFHSSCRIDRQMKWLAELSTKAEITFRVGAILDLLQVPDCPKCIAYNKDYRCAIKQHEKELGPLPAMAIEQFEKLEKESKTERTH